ncbi:MAG: HRDC domain-containing protein [Cytophagales bacterium]|nr:HRDC domain-containing protein [Armatimonadota bacterium]
MYIDTPAALATLAEPLRESLTKDPRLAFDTEFIRERTYSPVLEIVQISSGDGSLIAILDIPALKGELGDLGTLLLDPGVLKLVHAGGQDMEILSSVLGALPTPVFDTQVAAAFVGYSIQTGYGNLVQALLGVRLSKDEGFADWSRRPLTASMREYAENDVRYLPTLHTKLAGLLEKRSRADWAREQTERLLTSAAEELAPEDLWRRVGGRNILDARGLAILRELARWRDEEAQRRDKPRRSVVKDDFLIEVARRVPHSPAEVIALRAAPQNLGERAASALVERVQIGLSVSPTERPQPETPPALDEPGGVLVELLTAVVRARALEEDLPPTLLANGDDLRGIAALRGRKNQTTLGEHPLLNGWRGKIVGKLLSDVLSGETAIAWDSKNNRLRVLPVRETTD